MQLRRSDNANLEHDVGNCLIETELLPIKRKSLVLVVDDGASHDELRHPCQLGDASSHGREDGINNLAGFLFVDS